MAKRRDTYTAVLFLIALFSAVAFLLLGFIPSDGGFREASRPMRPDLLEWGHKAAPLETIHPPDRRRNWGNQPNRRKASGGHTGVLPIRGHATRRITYGEVEQAVNQFIASVDPAINEALDRQHTFIELYGGVQRLLGRRIVEDLDPQYTVVRLTDHLLTFASLEAETHDMTHRAHEMIAFSRRVKEEYQIPLLYVQAPSKLSVAPLPNGMENYTETEADQFLRLLQNGQVDTLDLRPTFRHIVETHPEQAEALFYHTDHHWTPAGAFLGYQTLAQKLNQAPYDFQMDEKVTDPENFTVYSFEKIFLGSQGRRVGSLYAGLDRFEIWSPKFSTDFTYSVPLADIQREGPFVNSLLFPERLADTGLYDTNPYTIYAGGDYLLTRAVNRNCPDGKRALVLRDSFGCVLTPFLSLGCQEVITIDPRNFNGNQDTMLEFMDWLKPDVVIVLNSTSSLRVDQLFPYLPTARRDALAAQRTGAK